ncbi:MAG: hypothetical protein PVJ67_00125 [Candidatus Pacearchaeota archaeon]|jgi:hypothetical protein
MFYKEIYSCLIPCKPKNIIIDEFEGSGYRMGDLFLISSRFDEETQCLALLHELVHDFPEFRGKSLGHNSEEKIEEGIEKTAKDIFNNRPLIRKYVNKQLELAREFPDNR